MSDEFNELEFEEIDLFDDDDLKITKRTIVRSVMFALALLNYVLEHFGFKAVPVTYEGAVVGATVIIFVWSMWKNNSFTMKARMADIFMKNLKEGDVSE